MKKNKKSKMLLRPQLRWSPARPIPPPDKIISSAARESGILGFRPSYDDDTEYAPIGLLLSNEYYRKWFNERATYDKDTYSREDILSQEAKMRRKYVQRMMTYKKPTKNSMIEQKVMERMKKDKSKGVDYTKMKYKPDCFKVDNRKEQTPKIEKRKEPNEVVSQTKSNQSTVVGESERTQSSSKSSISTKSDLTQKSGQYIKKQIIGGYPTEIMHRSNNGLDDNECDDLCGIQFCIKCP